MDADAFRILLQELDDLKHLERPPQFDHSQATARFQAFVADLETALASPMNAETGVEIQDASFHSQILFPNVALRFSNFGNLAALLEDENALPAAVVGTIKRLLAKHDDVYVPSAILAERYHGKNPGVTGIPNWWIRYFDWL